MKKNEDEKRISEFQHTLAPVLDRRFVDVKLYIADANVDYKQ